MAKVYFLSEEALKDNSILNGNIDIKYLQPTIWDAQEFYVLPALGTKLYNELKTQITASTLTSDNITLLKDYVQPYLIQCLKIELPPILLYKFQNKNIGTKSSEDSTPISMDEMVYLVDIARDKAATLARRMRLFLLANPTLYPSYLNQDSAKVDTIWAREESYTNGMFLGNMPKRKRSIGYDPGIFRNCEDCE